MTRLQTGRPIPSQAVLKALVRLGGPHLYRTSLSDSYSLCLRGRASEAKRLAMAPVRDLDLVHCEECLEAFGKLVRP